MKKTIIIFITFIAISLSASIRFEPVSINEENTALFKSNEVIGNRRITETLFLANLPGFLSSETSANIPVKAVTVYPENMVFSLISDKIYIQNRTGIYQYDISANSVSAVPGLAQFASGDEYIIVNPPLIAVSPDARYLITKIQKSSVKADIYLYNIQNMTGKIIATDCEINPDEPVALWSPDSRFIIYQKNNALYYLPIQDIDTREPFPEEWRLIGQTRLSNSTWTQSNLLVWIEDDLIYRADPSQFFTRSIYRKYLPQGHVIGKLPFRFDSDSDRFIYNEVSGKFLLIKNNRSVFFFSISDSINQESYLLLDDNVRFETGQLMDSGETIFTVRFIENGKLLRRVYLGRRNSGQMLFSIFNPQNMAGIIRSAALSMDKQSFVVNTDRGAYCYEFRTGNQLWNLTGQGIINSVSIDLNRWVLGGDNYTLSYNGRTNVANPLFGSSAGVAGLTDNGEIGVTYNGKDYIIDATSLTLRDRPPQTPVTNRHTNNKYRILSRRINKGFYSELPIVKDVYSGREANLIAEPRLRYRLYQPELVLDHNYYTTPYPEKYEVALKFNCTRDGDGVFRILESISNFDITASFFVSGVFMEINPTATRLISGFDFEVGNIFQYNINLTDAGFMITGDFIRQGLSSNEENYYRLTGKNFDPVWHAPFYAFNEDILRFGLDAGYSFISYHLDSLDGIGRSDQYMANELYMNNDRMIQRIVDRLKPGQIIIMQTGRNGVDREDRLYDDLDLLICELVRSGYSFTTAGDIMKRYRQ